MAVISVPIPLSDPDECASYLLNSGISATVSVVPGGLSVAVSDPDEQAAIVLLSAWVPMLLRSPLPDAVASAVDVFRQFDDANPSTLSQAQIILLFHATKTLLRYLNRRFEE